MKELTVCGKDGEMYTTHVIVESNGFFVTRCGWGYSINHASGLSLTATMTISNALNLIDCFSEIRIGGIGLACMPVCEISSNAISIKNQLIGLVRLVDQKYAKKLKSFDELNSAEKISNIWCSTEEVKLHETTNKA